MVDVDVVTQIAVEFREFLVEAHQSAEDVDEHLKMIAGFILMTNDFRDFVDCYRCSDSTGSEKGYYNFAPVWKMTGQIKYVQCWVEQLFQINEKHRYSFVQTARHNRSHRSYPESTDKDCTGKDE